MVIIFLIKENKHTKKMKFLFTLLFISSSCTSYSIPIQTKNHPANFDLPTCSIELSPILEIKDSDVCSEL